MVQEKANSKRRRKIKTQNYRSRVYIKKLKCKK